MKNKKMTDAYKNAMGTVFLLAGAFFICSTFLSMRTVLADPIAPGVTGQSRVAPARAAARATGSTRSTVARSTVARTTSPRPTTVAAGATTKQTTGGRTVATRSTRTRNVNAVSQSQGTAANRAISARRIVKNDAGTVANNVAGARGVKTRGSNRVVARTATTQAAQSRVSLVGTGMRASNNTSGVTVSHLTNKLYTGNYSNIIDSQTGLISADAYSNCLESYYTCMDEICTARSDTKGRCSCAGRATNFLAAESALEKANEELIQLSGQLALLISTKGKGEDLSYAFSLTDAEKVMNCVSYKDAREVAGTTKNSLGNTVSKEEHMQNWCQAHMMYDSSKCGYNTMPDYCSEKNNDFGFDIQNIDGSSSDILASLKAWADAKDLAKQYTVDDSNNLLSQYTTISGVVNGLSGVTTSIDANAAQLDGLANKWGYELFEYAHNNVCGRVLDSCFNGIYEACGTPPSGTDSAGNKIGKCANGASSNCPYNYNSAISVVTNGEGAGDIALNERGSSNTTTTTSATCFGYTSNSGDPYSSLRAPVADARRSIMQKYLLDANAACDVYGTSLKNTAQNINYQKIAAEQALRQKRLEFKQELDATVLSDATTAGMNFDECLSEILDCYESQADNTTYSGAKWTEARIKTYCAQISQIPHCYETMICSPINQQFHAIIDKPDDKDCFNSTDYTQNTCRNVVTLNELLYVQAVNPEYVGVNKHGDSLSMREKCLMDAGVGPIRDWTADTVRNVKCSVAQIRAADKNAAAGYTTSDSDESCEHITACNEGYLLRDEKCIVAPTQSCASLIENAEVATTTQLSNGTWATCKLERCQNGYDEYDNKCVKHTDTCEDGNGGIGTHTFDKEMGRYGNCEVTSCTDPLNEHVEGGVCVSNEVTCYLDANTDRAIKTWNTSSGNWGACEAKECKSGFHVSGNVCVSNTTTCTSAEARQKDAHALTCVKEWVNTRWNVKVTTCETGWYPTSDRESCTLEYQACSDGVRSGRARWNGTDYGSCQYDGCVSTVQHLENGGCVNNQRPCNTVERGTKPFVDECTATYNETSGGYSISVQSCVNGYHNENNNCVNNVRDCTGTVSHASLAQQTWNTESAWNVLCEVKACENSYHNENNQCISNTRECDPADWDENATSCTLTWNNVTEQYDVTQGCAAGWTWDNALQMCKPKSSGALGV